MKTILDSGENERTAHIYDTLDPNAQQEDDDDAEELPEMDTTELPDEVSSTNPKPIDSCKFRPIIPDEDSEMCRKVRVMSFDQRI